MTASGLLIASAVLHALWNALIKKASDTRIALLVVLFFAAFVATLAAALGSSFQFGGAEGFLWTIGAGICEGGYLITLALTLERAPLGLSYTVMRGGAMIAVWVISSGLLGEPISWLGISGVGVVLVGLTTTNRASPMPGKPDITRIQGLRWAYLCAAFIAGYHLCYGQAMSLGALPLPLFAFALWVAVPVLVLFNGFGAVTSGLRLIRLQPVTLILGGGICAASFLVFLIGMSHSGAGAAITLRNTSVFFAQIFALMLGERVSSNQWLGSLLVVVGALLLSLS